MSVDLWVWVEEGSEQISMKLKIFITEKVSVRKKCHHRVLSVILSDGFERGCVAAVQAVGGCSTNRSLGVPLVIS